MYQGSPQGTPPTIENYHMPHCTNGNFAVNSITNAPRSITPCDVFLSKLSVRKACNKVGGALLIFSGIGTVVTIILEIIILIFAGIQGIENFTVNYALSGIVSIVSLMLPGIILAKLARVRLDNIISFKKVSVKKLLAFLCVAFSFAIGGNILLQFLNTNISLFGLENTISDIGGEHTPLDCIFMVISIAIIPPLVEEFLFRGVILGYLRKFGDGFAIIISALAFGFAHGNFVQTPVTFIVGLLMGYMTVYFKSIIPAMLLHFLNNFYSVIYAIMEMYFDEKIMILFNALFMLTMFCAGFVLMIKLSRRDKNILKLEGSTCILPLKERIVCALTNPCMIIFIVLQLLSSILVLSMSNAGIY